MKAIDKLDEWAVNLAAASRISDGVFLSKDTILKLSKAIYEGRNSIAYLEHDVRSLQFQLKLSEEMRNDNKTELSDEDKDVAEGLGLNVEESE